MRLWSVFLLLALAGCRLMPEGGAGDASSDSPPGPHGIYRVEPAGEIARFAGPVDMSSISRIGGDLYVTVSDSDGTLAELELAVDGQTGEVGSCRCVRSVRLASAVDAEGIAFDRFSCHVWVSDEASESIREYDMSGGLVRELRMPECFKRCRGNLGLESLEIGTSGLVMWTCNEEALTGDGERSSTAGGSLVRLTKFVRDAPAGEWRLAGQWVYRTGRVKGGTFHGVSASGVSDLCELPDGTLIVLEREMSRTILPRFRMRLYQVDFTGATEVSGIAALKGAEWKPVRKSRIYEELTGRANYEGMCLGPELPDGSRTLILVSDGDGLATERLRSFRLKSSPHLD